VPTAVDKPRGPESDAGVVKLEIRSGARSSSIAAANFNASFQGERARQLRLPLSQRSAMGAITLYRMNAEMLHPIFHRSRRATISFSNGRMWPP